MFHLGTPAWQVIVRSLAVYGAVFFGLRVMGKRQLGQMTLFDLVVIILIANAVQNAMVGPDTSLQGGILAAFVLLVANFGVSRLRLLNPRFERLLEGAPTVLVRDGALVAPNLKREAVDPAEVETAVREHGLADVREVRVAYLEPDGSISVVPMSAQVYRSKRRVRQLRKH